MRHNKLQDPRKTGKIPHWVIKDWSFTCRRLCLTLQQRCFYISFFSALPFPWHYSSTLTLPQARMKLSLNESGAMENTHVYAAMEFPPKHWITINRNARTNQHWQAWIYQPAHQKSQWSQPLLWVTASTTYVQYFNFVIASEIRR